LCVFSEEWKKKEKGKGRVRGVERKRRGGGGGGGGGGGVDRFAVIFLRERDSKYLLYFVVSVIY